MCEILCLDKSGVVGTCVQNTWDGSKIGALFRDLSRSLFLYISYLVMTILLYPLLPRLYNFCSHTHKLSCCSPIFIFPGCPRFFFSIDSRMKSHVVFTSIMHTSWIFFACIRPEIPPLAGNCTPLIGDRMQPGTGREGRRVWRGNGMIPGQFGVGHRTNKREMCRNSV